MAFRVASILQKAPKSWGQAGARSLGTAAAVPAEVVVVGSNIIDMTAYTPRLPQLGETVLGHQFQRGFGGKGANQCVQAAMLGVPTGMVTMVGDDGFGKETIANFQSHGVDTTNVLTTDTQPSGCAPILVDDDGNNCIVVCAAANMVLTPDDVDNAAAMIQGAKVVVCQMEIPRETTLRALRVARDAGVTTIFNPAPAVTDLEEDFFQLADVFCPNETEAALITGLPTNTDDEIVVAARALLRRGARSVLMTLGERGVLLVGGDDAEQTIHIPGRDVHAIDTSGAGDSFLGSFSAFLALGLDAPEAMRRAVYVAGESVQGRGTQASFKGRAELPESLFA